jgi:hypothetical protein
MKTLLFVTLLTATGLRTFAESTPAPRPETPSASRVGQGIFWIADTRKMDAFLATLDLATIRDGATHQETLPDTRSVWRDYAHEARVLALRKDTKGAQNRLGQMLKLAALYRAYGGLQNVAQGEEIRALAGQTARQTGCGGLIDSPYLEHTLGECLAQIEQQAGADRGAVRPAFWQHLMESARDSFLRLSGQAGGAVADSEPAGSMPLRTVTVIH